MGETTSSTQPAPHPRNPNAPARGQGRQDPPAKNGAGGDLVGPIGLPTPEGEEFRPPCDRRARKRRPATRPARRLRNPPTPSKYGSGHRYRRAPHASPPPDSPGRERRSSGPTASSPPPPAPSPPPTARRDDPHAPRPPSHDPAQRLDRRPRWRRRNRSAAPAGHAKRLPRYA